MARKIYRIDEFIGIDQSMGENGMSPAYSPDACNMDTSDGELSVAKGYTRHIAAPVPGSGPIRRMHLFHAGDGDRVIVLAGNELYACINGEWGLIYTFTGGLLQGKVDFAEAGINGTDYLLIGSGEQAIVKYDGSAVSLFGSPEGLSDIHVRYLAMYRNRLFSAGDPQNPNRLYWSKLPGSGRTIEDWGEEESSVNVSGGHAEIGESAGDPIVGVAALSNQLMIFKKRSIYRLIGDKPSNFTVEKVDSDLETAAYTSLVTGGDMLYFMTKGGLCRFNGVTAAPMADARRIKNTLLSASVEDTKGAIARSKLYFTIRENQNSDAIVEYDLLRRAYMLRRGFDAADIAAWDGRLYLINSARYVYLFDEGTSYDGAPIEAKWRTPETDLFDKSGVKAMRSLCFRGRSQNRETALVAEVSVGGGKTRSRVLLPLEQSDVVEVPLKNEGRTFSLTLSNEAGGSFTLTGGAELSFETWRRVE